MHNLDRGLEMLKRLIIFFILFSIFFSLEVRANDCPTYKFAKKYSVSHSDSPVANALFIRNPGKKTIYKIKRLSSDQYLVEQFLTTGLDSFILTEECGKVFYEYTRTGRVTYTDGQVVDTEITATCDGFLKSNKVVSATCILSFIDINSDLQEDTLSVKWRPIR